MSFILQAFHAPGASTIDDASRAIDSLGAAGREDRLRLIRFLTALNERFPSDLDDEDNPWPEGLAPEYLDHAVYVFTVGR